MLKLIKEKNPRESNGKQSAGQVTLEYMFCLIVVTIMFYSLLRIAEWSGEDLAARRYAHESTLLNQTGIDEQYGNDLTRSPLKQIHPFFYFPEGMNATWPGAM